MARFLVVHKVPQTMTQEEAIETGKAIVTTQSGESRWLRSWYLPEDDRLLCEWEAPEGETIQTALRKVKHFPVETIQLVQPVDPAWFKS